MTAMTDLERRVAAWLDEDGPRGVAAGVVDAALAAAATQRQRPAWTLREWWVPRGTRSGGGWPRDPGPADAHPARVLTPSARLAWVIAALLGLIALLGGVLAAGGWFRASTLGAFACPAGSDPHAPGPVGQERPPGDAPMIAEWAGDGRILVMTRTGAPWTWDVCANTWQPPADADARLAERWPDERWPWGGTPAFDGASGLLVVFGDMGVAVRDRDGAWSYRDGASRWGSQVGYDPDADRIIVRDIVSRQMWTYDVDTDAWYDLEQHPAPPPTRDTSAYQLTTFDPAGRRFVLVDGSNGDGHTWLLDPRTSTWTQGRSWAPIQLFIQTDEIDYDIDGGRVVTYANGRVQAYETATDTWEVLFEIGQDQRRYDRSGSGVAYDRVNKRLVVFGGNVRDDVAGWTAIDDVVAFDLDTGTWVELLAPSAGATR